jgi:cyclopropane fatty-acyl-phospholipid synthase-like methyltransferase
VSTETAALNYYRASYGDSGFDAQRRYPNEELCRFMGRNFFRLPTADRKKTRILEVGCGSGANLWMVAREGFDAWGLDFSEEALALCRQMLERYGVAATLTRGDMRDTQLPSGQFDAVVDVFAANCFTSADHARFLDEVRRLLKPGGLFFSYTPSKRSDAYLNHAPAELLDASTLNGVQRKGSPYIGNNYPFRFTTNEEFGADLEARGFRVARNEQLGRTEARRAEYFEFVVIEAQSPS